MAVLQKQLMDVRLLGLDEKANPRTTQPGTIVDGLNWTMDKDGRVKKRPGLTALSMLDTDGATISGGRELCALGDEMVLATRDKLYGRDATSGAWAPKGRRAYESSRIWSATATNAPCDGTDSLLQADCATIGRYVLVLSSGGNALGSESESGWMLLDGTSGAVLQSRVAMPTGYFGFTASDTGEVTSPRFIAFALERGTNNLAVAEWDADHRGVTWSPTITDIAIIDDRNTYGLQPAGFQAAPYAVVRTAANTWLIAYQQTGGGNFVVRKLERGGPNAFTLSTASTIEASLPSVSLVPAIAHKPGSTWATVAAMYYGTLYYGDVTISTMDVSATGNVEPTTWTCTGDPPLNKPFCRGMTGIISGVVPYFFVDVITYDGSYHRSVWLWTTLRSDAVRVVRNAGLLCHVAQYLTAESGELALGVAHFSSLQPSAFIMRLHVAASTWSWMSIGAHLCAGDHAGRACTTLMPNLASNTLALGILNEPVSLGGPGTVLLKVAKNGHAETSIACSQPAEIAGSLLLPGACLKSYDGQHVTEAAFPLGPESVSVAESSIGITFGANDDGDLIPYPNVIGDDTTSPAPAASSISCTFSGAGITLRTLAGYPGVTPWPAGTASISLWCRVVDPTAGHSYYLVRGASPEAYAIKTSETDLAWQDATVANAALTTDWQQITWSVAVKALSGATTVDRLEVVVKPGFTGAGDDSASFELGIGGTHAPVISVPFAVIETGTRLYRSCLAWTDSRGRTQRSQLSPVTSQTNVYGRTNAVTIPMVTVTERSPVTNLDALIHPAVIEVYRTEAAGTTYYKVGQITNVPNAADAVLYDRLPDTSLIANAQLYTTGGTVEMWPPIGCNLVASHQGRAFAVTADNRVVFTAFATEGEGLAFAAEFTVDTGHLPGVISALLSLDDKLAICSQSAVAPLTGVGPELTGTPVYDSPMVIGTQFGPLGQRSCVRIPTGYAMITAHGVYMLDRGLSFSWTGAQVTDEVPGSYAWTAATYTPGGDQIRFSTTGLVLVHDLTLPSPPNRAGQWFKWTHPTAVWAWATVAGVLHQLMSNGNVYQADSGLTDYGTSYQEWVKLALVSPAGPNGWSRIYRLELTCDVASGTTIKIAFTNDDYALTENANLLAGPLKHVAAEPRHGQCSRMTIWIGENAATATAGITLDAIGLLVGVKGGLGRLGAANRAARST